MRKKEKEGGGVLSISDLYQIKGKVLQLNTAPAKTFTFFIIKHISVIL